ncbi:plasmid mobilization protein [Clostridium tarantellae]|uniref:Uncharacterized protein n=1 Tax=Clostridium tarantellae TaxID=39493 RepID=A0A6I1MQI1_9CLOT|nr:hypothetical protein [Clostridium tarantellae]MPQ45304.1 hypothetical protein [Clostridium tarantellae]
MDLMNTNKDKYLRIRVTEKERKEVQDIAKNRGFKNTSEYLRYCIMRETKESVLNAETLQHIDK